VTPMVSRQQTVEDGGPRRAPDITLHHEGTTTEFIRVSMPIRRPYSMLDFSAQLVIDASRVTGRVTAALKPKE